MGCNHDPFGSAVFDMSAEEQLGTTEQLFEVREQQADDPENDYCELHTLAELRQYARYAPFLEIVGAFDFFSLDLVCGLYRLKITAQ